MTCLTVPRSTSWNPGALNRFVVPEDGTVFASLAQTLALDSAVDPSSDIDVTKLPYLGRVTSNTDVGVASKTSGIISFADVRKKS